MDLMELIGIIIGSGGFGSLITYLIRLYFERRLREAQTKQEEIAVADKQETLEKDRFEAMYIQINKMIEDYNALDDDYRIYRKDAAERERLFAKKVSDKCALLAALKSQILYLKELTCYDTNCKCRIKNNPDRTK